MSESTPESAPAGEVSEAQAEGLLADAVAEQSAASPDPAPAAPPSDPAPQPTAPEADDDWADPEKGREAKRKANQEARKLRAEIESLRQQIEQRVDPEESRAAIALVEAEKERTVARLRFGHQYGLPDSIVDRLQGDTAEDIEADAKRLAPLFSTSGADLGRGGLDPTDEPVKADPRSLAAKVERRF